jgi:hypothetical protein
MVIVNVCQKTNYLCVGHLIVTFTTHKRQLPRETANENNQLVNMVFVMKYGQIKRHRTF